MPEPISRATAPAAEPFSDAEAGQVSHADATNSSLAEPPITCSPEEGYVPSSPAVPKLVSSVPPPPSALPPTASPGATNAQRTSERLGPTPYASAGLAGSDSAFAGAALIKGRDPKSGASIEVLSASVQLGAQSEAQVGLQRIAAARGPLSGSVEAFTARANVGIHNDDGSTGLNVGAGATAIGFEGTVGGASSVTYGVAASVGAAGSLGIRDQDRDGKTELCARFSLGPVTVGACLENPL